MPPKQKTPAKGQPPKSDPTQHLLVDDLPQPATEQQQQQQQPLSTSSSSTAAPASPELPQRKLAYPIPKRISHATIINTESLLRFVILGLISAAAVASRLFAVIRFESVIHEL